MPYEREDFSPKLKIGDKIPSFELPATDGNSYDNSYFDSAPAKLVVFACNHCPYVKGSELNLIEVVKRHADKGLKVLMISSNDAVNYPEDSFEKMKEKSIEMNLPYPYLYDESQDVAKSFDAACTPECYLFDKEDKLVFHGGINDSPKDPSAAKNIYIDRAVQQLLEGQGVEPAFAHPIGCSIKWK